MTAHMDVLRILIVDDSRDDRVECKAALLRGFQRRLDLREAELGRTALEICAREPIDCVLLDHHLPDMSGFDVIERLTKPDRAVPSVPVVIVTGSDEPQGGGAISRAGAMGFIGKDWLTPGSLARTVELAMERHAMFVEQAALVQALQDREYRLQLALTAGRAGTFLHELVTGRVIWSAELEAMFGYTAGAFEGTFDAFLDRIHPSDRKRTADVIAHAIARHQEYEFDFRAVRLDGDIVHLSGRGRAYAKDGKNVDTITGVVFDVSARKRAEEELRQREQHLRLAQTAGRLGTWDWDIVRDSATWSEQAGQLLDPGGSLREVDRDYFLRCLHPDDRDRADQMIARALVVGKYRDEFRVGHPPGGTRWMESVGEVLRDDHGAPIRMIGVLRDVTERKLGELALQSSERRFRQLSQTLPHVIFTASAAGELDWVNAFWHEFTGEAVFSTAAWDACLHPDERAGWVGAWERHVRAGQPFSVEYRIRRADGVHRWHLFRVAPVWNDQGAVTQWVGSAIDIDVMREEARLREDLVASERAARSEAEEANQLKDEFLATLSHELRTPLSSVLSWARTLQKRYPQADEIMRRALDVIVDNANAQARIINDILDINRIIRGKVSLAREPLDLGKLLEGCCTSQRPAAEAKGVRLHFDVPARQDTISVSADRARLQQVFGNLLSNAIKFTPAGGDITLRAQRRENGVEVTVTDNGDGIDPAMLPHIFDRFRQAGTSRSAGGLGLGLAIAKQLVTLHGGEIEACSRGLHAGAVFTVRLPLQSTANLEPAAPPPPDEEMASPDDLAGLQIYVVEDQSAILEYTCSVLRDHGAEVSGFGSGDALLRHLSEADGRPGSGPIVLVSDLSMPGVSGFELPAAMGRSPLFRTRPLTAIAVSALSRTEDRRRAFDRGFQECLVKPVDVGRLIAAVRRLTRQSTPSPTSVLSD